MTTFFGLRTVVAALMMTIAAAAFLPDQAKAQDASITLRVGKVGFIVGASGGNGVLSYRGQQYPLSVAGMSVGLTIGAAEADLVGDVYNLRRVSDIEGIYTAIESSMTAGGGEGEMRLKNSNGVEIFLHGKQAGIEASLATSGVQISLR
ncbi:lipid-binding SYLF domain-containing protein [Rhodobium orientis]|uniref:DUF1134 domain-containing protein n=1 Tax=Rhodobium orientis TaxID=34017 RepID=A0A327JT90_9HYPH|nr:hypothetical protein [Rhodobium orientis]MBB4304341.1 lipid-binding SYLF domain-containing protein [Rhodobium orientis]MBK5948165.1 hypothetical protein [Rhodobium orientis]RAI28835.1 hypothetical protein CH339_05425 [Rhodobium orientis]